MTLTKKHEPFVWELKQQVAFLTRITGITTAPAHLHFHYETEENIGTDVSNYVSTGVLSQFDDEGVLHPVAYFSNQAHSC